MRNYIKLIGCLFVIVFFLWMMHNGMEMHLGSMPIYHTIRERNIDASTLFYTESEISVQSERKLKKY